MDLRSPLPMLVSTRPESPLAGLPEFACDRETLVALYRGLVLTRTFDEQGRGAAADRAARHLTPRRSGRKRSSVGAAAAMRPDDVLLPSFREHGAQLWRGVSPVELLLYWGGDERGSDFADRGRISRCRIPVGQSHPARRGVALAMKLRGEPRAAVASSATAPPRRATSTRR